MGLQGRYSLFGAAGDRARVTLEEEEKSGESLERTALQCVFLDPKESRV